MGRPEDDYSLTSVDFAIIMLSIGGAIFLFLAGLALLAWAGADV